MTNRLAACWLTMILALMAHLGLARRIQDPSSVSTSSSPAFVSSSLYQYHRHDGWRNLQQLRSCRQSVKVIAALPPTLSRWPKQARTRTVIMARYMTDPTDSQQQSVTIDTAADIATTKDAVWTRERLEEYASQQGIVLSLSTLGPGYRALARAKHNTTLILGYVEGFVRPTGNILHLDKMQVFAKIVQQARSENPDEFKGGGTIFGPGLLVGYLCLLFGAQQGCRVAEFLAIDDADFQHKRYVCSSCFVRLLTCRRCFLLARFL
jgi:hypothetical protein